MTPSSFYAPVEAYIGRVRLYGTDKPHDSRAMNETELKARDQFTRIFGVIAFDEDSYDAMFRVILKNLEHCDKLQPITLKDLK